MLKITFLDVGTGDSIVIEWEDNNENKIAVLDCNLGENKCNPTVDYIKSLKYDFNKSIEFVFLSHPHTDHFSGLDSLIEYCYNEDISINKFYHTLTYNKEFLKSLGNNEIKTRQKYEEIVFPVKGTAIGSPRSKLEGLLTLIRKNILAYRPPIHNLHPIDDDKEIQLNSKLKIKILAPSFVKDIVRYINNPEEFADCGVSDVKNKQEGNILSTVISIEDESWYLLLTSDAKKEVLERIYKEKNNEYLQRKSIKLFQIPHHGSEKNHNPEIWMQLKGELICKSVVSVGQNNRYKFPSKEVIDFFTSDGFECYSTSNKNVSYSEMKRKETLLNATNFTKNCRYEIIPESGNLSFLLNNNGNFELCDSQNC